VADDPDVLASRVMAATFPARPTPFAPLLDFIRSPPGAGTTSAVSIAMVVQRRCQVPPSAGVVEYADAGGSCGAPERAF